MNATAPSIGVKLPEKPEDCVVETDVHLIGDLKKLDLGIRVDMVIKARNMEKADLEKLVEKTKTICPYSRATQGNARRLGAYQHAFLEHTPIRHKDVRQNMHTSQFQAMW